VNAQFNHEECTMALSQSELIRLLESLRSTDGIELIRAIAERMVQELIEAEASAHVGAEWNERTPSRTNIRNGHREKVLTTLAGDLDLEIPKVRTGSFFPSLLERRRRIDQALYAVIMEAYVHGVSTRSVDDLVKALGGDSGISKSEVSRICAALDEPLTAFRTRPLDHVRFPYVYLDATYCKARVNHQIVSRAVVVATGGTPGRRLGEHHRRRRPRGPGPDGRRQRERGVLEGVPALAARARPVRGPPGRHRPARRTGRGGPQGDARRRLAAVQGSLKPSRNNPLLS